MLYKSLHQQRGIQRTSRTCKWVCFLGSRNNEVSLESVLNAIFLKIVEKIHFGCFPRNFLKKILFRSSYPDVFLGKRVLKICSKFTGENPCRSVISIKLQNNFIEITPWYECSPVNLLHIFRTPSF